MVITLIRKELRDSLNIFTPIIAITVALIVLVYAPIVLTITDYEALMSDSSATLMMIVSLLLVAFLIALFVLSVMAYVKVLYTNIYNNKGYELFTLPIKSWQIIVAKISTIFIWSFMIIVFGFITLSLTHLLIGEFDLIKESFFEIYRFAFANFTDFSTWFRFTSAELLSTLVSFLTILFAGAFANSKYIQRNRAAVTFVIFIAITIGLSYLENSFFIQTNPLIPFSEPYYLTQSYYLIASTRLLEVILMFAGVVYLWDNKLELTTN